VLAAKNAPAGTSAAVQPVEAKRVPAAPARAALATRESALTAA